MSESKIEALVDALTVEEQVSLLAGKDFWTTVPIERLGIPSIKVSDGPNGARGGGAFVGGISAAAFPVGIALAATWNLDLVGEIGAALADEARSKGARVLLAPTVNIHRSTLNGRNFECYSEDPFLTSEIAVAYISALQARGVAATIKHFIGNESEYQRDTISSDIDERPLREIYMPPFEAAVKRAKTWAVMTSYNRLNGTYVSERSDIVNGVLKREWGFDGLVMSDWSGTKSTVEAMNGGPRSRDAGAGALSRREASRGLSRWQGLRAGAARSFPALAEIDRSRRRLRRPGHPAGARRRSSGSPRAHSPRRCGGSRVAQEQWRPAAPSGSGIDDRSYRAQRRDRPDHGWRQRADQSALSRDAARRIARRRPVRRVGRLRTRRRQSAHRRALRRQGRSRIFRRQGFRAVPPATIRPSARVSSCSSATRRRVFRR